MEFRILSESRNFARKHVNMLAERLANMIFCERRHKSTRSNQKCFTKVINMFHSRSEYFQSIFVCHFESDLIANSIQ